MKVKDEALYYFQNWDYEKGLKLDDFSYKIVLNTRCSVNKVSAKLRPLFAYINSAENVGGSELVDKIDERVQKFSTDEWRRKQMTFEYYVKDKERRAYRSAEEAGEARSKFEIARNLILLGISTDKITEATGLSIAEIEALQN